MLLIKSVEIIDESFRSMIKSGNYEKYVLKIINRSKCIFAGRHFCYIKEQSHSECDFKDNMGRKYEAKLLFSKKQGQLIGDPKNQIKAWVQTMRAEKAEFAESFQKRDLSLVKNTEIYRIMKERLESVAVDENAILFIPYPIVDDYTGGIFRHFAADFLQAAYDQLPEECVFGDREVFFIYPSMNPKEYVLRNAYMVREYIRCDELDDIIKYGTRLYC